MFLCNVCCSEKYDKVEKTRTDKDERKDKSKDSQVFEIMFFQFKGVTVSNYSQRGSTPSL